MDTDKKVYVIGGITGGIGQALAQRLLQAGHLVAGFARDADRLHALRDTCDYDLQSATRVSRRPEVCARSVA